MDRANEDPTPDDVEGPCCECGEATSLITHDNRWLCPLCKLEELGVPGDE